MVEETSIMEKRMVYRLYKKRFDACQNRDEAMDLLLRKWEAFKDWMGWA